MLETIIQLDHALFELINGQWHNDFLDGLMPLWRNRFFWMPLYLFVSLFIYFNYSKQWAIIIGMLAITFGIADFTSSSLVKSFFERARPCHEPALFENFRLLVHCGSGYSFTSSHATNHFAIAMFWAVWFLPINRRIAIVVLVWAATVAYGQVYVGVHFPLDILGGAFLGSLIGYIGARATQALTQRLRPAG